MGPGCYHLVGIGRYLLQLYMYAVPTQRAEMYCTGNTVEACVSLCVNTSRGTIRRNQSIQPLFNT